MDWYAQNSRDLPWRAPGTRPWGVLVSEVMLAQTPVSRVAPVWLDWMARWPGPAVLASESPAEAIRAWGRLGYPRRALRLHETARILERDHGGEVPATYAALRALPGIGDYTAAAVLAFAYRQRAVVLDTNVRRVLARHTSGQAAPSPSVSAAERRMAAALLPADPPTASTWSVAVMELGALVCTAASPQCAECPIASDCRWHTLGKPAYAGPKRRAQRFTGTDRQVRGLLLDVLRASSGDVAKTQLTGVWSDHDQRERALDSLIADGLVETAPSDHYRLPIRSPDQPEPGSLTWASTVGTSSS